MAISPQRLTIYLYSSHRAVIFAIAQLSCFELAMAVTTVRNEWAAIVRRDILQQSWYETTRHRPLKRAGIEGLSVSLRHIVTRTVGVSLGVYIYTVIQKTSHSKFFHNVDNRPIFIAYICIARYCYEKVVCPSVCLSVCLSVTLADCDHIGLGWNSSKII